MIERLEIVRKRLLARRVALGHHHHPGGRRAERLLDALLLNRGLAARRCEPEVPYLKSVRLSARYAGTATTITTTAIGTMMRWHTRAKPSNEA